jgi:hypothetical protein
MAHPPFNPLDKQNLGASVAKALLERPVGSLPPQASFLGAGIYAIYYTGNIRTYAPIKERNKDGKFEQPIYVGKAVPAGARKGGFGLGLNPGSVLFSRLIEHARSIESCPDLKVTDFSCRYLIADDIWIPLGEALLIEQFKPIWNVLVAGFGNHDPGAGRRQQQKSLWDVLHPGRSWASLLQANSKDIPTVKALVKDFFAGKSVPLIPTDQAVSSEEPT